MEGTRHMGAFNSHEQPDEDVCSNFTVDAETISSSEEPLGVLTFRYTGETGFMRTHVLPEEEP